MQNKYRGARYVPGGPRGFMTESPIGNGTGVRVTEPWTTLYEGQAKTKAVTKKATKFKKGSKLHRTVLTPEQVAHRVKFGF